MLPQVYYKAAEFAKIAGITVRTLHHYDQLGLLKPQRSSQNKYRLYTENDLIKLEQVSVLRFIGLPLRDIQRLLRANHINLPAVLNFQYLALQGRKRNLEQALSAIEDLQHSLKENSSPDWTLIKTIIKTVTKETDMDWIKKYYTKEQLEELAKHDTKETREKGEQAWRTLILDIENSLNESPQSPAAQALAKRWQQLILSFTQGNQQTEKSLSKMYSDQKNWPATFQKPYSDEVENFIKKAIAAQKSQTP